MRFGKFDCVFAVGGEEMFDNYVLLDIENPNSRGNSICAIAVITVKNGEVVDEKYSLINPEDRFDAINSRITGIDASQVQCAPTLNVFWPEISELLLNNVIVGHNITYDLSVLERALQRYDIDVPGFKYICTLALSRQYIQSSSYKLEELATKIGFDFEPHIAINDAVAAGKLFEYIKSFYKISTSAARFYSLESKTKDKIDERLISNLNTLKGIIEGITADSIVNPSEIQRLREWVEENAINKQYSLFAKIIDNLVVIIEDNVVDEYEQLKLRCMVSEYTSSKLYCETTLGIQVLQGILDGISCDQTIVDTEIFKLEKWLQEHDYLTGVYPYDKILHMVQDVVSDGIIDENEKDLLLKSFAEVINPMEYQDSKDNASIDLAGKSFCLTGEFVCSQKAVIAQKLQEKGAIEKSGVSAKLDYLFVGGAGSDAWKFGKIGGKIAKALELQEKGKKIQIISEENMGEILQDS